MLRHVDNQFYRMLRHAGARNYISFSFKNGNQMHQYEGPEPWIFKIKDDIRSFDEICPIHRQQNCSTRNFRLNKIRYIIISNNVIYKSHKYNNNKHKLCVLKF